jgi:hypothetical protein
MQIMEINKNVTKIKKVLTKQNLFCYDRQDLEISRNDSNKTQ